MTAIKCINVLENVDRWKSVCEIYGEKTEKRAEESPPNIIMRVWRNDVDTELNWFHVLHLAGGISTP